ncbi:MAG: hydroxymethylglutaryl-CoA reductase [Prolixibacteraceae bacterium]|nr:hydroxymethylglutaryl-CoA reductase [Prolixibacteraceae bacterium]
MKAPHSSENIGADKASDTHSFPDGFVKGFSKFNRAQRMAVITKDLDESIVEALDQLLYADESLQAVFSEISENHLSNHVLPLGIVPNVLVNNELYHVPVVIEESSVVAAASRAAGFWALHGGFQVEILGTLKKGQIHFTWTGDKTWLFEQIELLKSPMLVATAPETSGMQKRGGGITAIALLDFTASLQHYYQLDVSFETADAMGANFINSCLEKMGEVLDTHFSKQQQQGHFERIMSILSNHTPECLVRCTVSCAINELQAMSADWSPTEFARRFKTAVDMANVSVSRAVTHNKGILNGVDGLVLATGNDWRAVEAAGHAYAAKDGRYRSLSHAEINDDLFSYTLTLPLAIGTVGGLTQIHPLVKQVLKILRNPNAQQLMMLMAALGMANNFSALTSLVTSGIQKGHMKMHLGNVLHQLGASPEQKIAALEYFSGQTISYASVEKFLKEFPGNTHVSQ